MPIYEYRCTNGHTFEVMQRISDDPVQKCEVCGASVQRVFHPVAVHFKGSGFYNTDYGTRKRARELKESGEGGASSSNGSSPGEGKTSSESKTGSSGSSESKSSESKTSGAKASTGD